MPPRVLTALDSARIQYYHFKAIIVAGMGLFTDSYDLFCIPPIMILIGRIYYAEEKEPWQYKFPSPVVSTMVGIALLGTAIGQVVFGIMGDRKGRRRVYGLALKLMVLSSLGCGFSICGARRCVLVSLGFFRFFLGLGIGGDYPLSAVILSENANQNQRGGMMAAMFSLQGFGILASSIVTVVVCKVFEKTTSKALLNDHSRTPEAADLAWRLILMIGAIPAGLTYYWRMLMPETARFTALVENNVAQATQDMEGHLDVPLNQIQVDNENPQPPTPLPSFHYPLLSMHFLRRYGLQLFSCSITWLILDIPFYGATLFQSQIYDQYLKIGRKSYNAYEETYQVAKLQAIVAICATIPGYFFTIFFIDKIGRRKIQIIGFFCMGILYLVLGIPYPYWAEKKNIAFICFYGLTFFFANFGPNATTFIVPAELFPARFRTTCHGISGAFGKVGAFIGAIGFQWASENKDYSDYYSKIHRMRIALLILGGLCFLGVVVSYFLTPETKERSLEENENQDGNSMELSLLRCFTDTSRRQG